MKSLMLLGVSVAVILVLACSGDDAGGERNVIPPTEAAEVRPTQTPSPEPTATPAIPEDNRIRIPIIRVDAPLTLKVVTRTGVMEDPDTADDVAIYDFSAFPQYRAWFDQGNLLLGGKVDDDAPCNNGRVPPPCLAVFWDIDRLVAGDEVIIFWEQQPHRYTVVGLCVVTVENFEAAIGRTSSPSITLLTGTGVFVPGSGYSQRLLVRAEAKPGTLSRECPKGTDSVPPGLAPDLLRTPTPTPRPF